MHIAPLSRKAARWLGTRSLESRAVKPFLCGGSSTPETLLQAHPSMLCWRSCPSPGGRSHGTPMALPCASRCFSCAGRGARPPQHCPVPALAGQPGAAPRHARVSVLSGMRSHLDTCLPRAAAREMAGRHAPCSRCGRPLPEEQAPATVRQLWADGCPAARQPAPPTPPALSRPPVQPQRLPGLPSCPRFQTGQRRGGAAQHAAGLRRCSAGRLTSAPGRQWCAGFRHRCRQLCFPPAAHAGSLHQLYLSRAPALYMTLYERKDLVIYTYKINTVPAASLGLRGNRGREIAGRRHCWTQPAAGTHWYAWMHRAMATSQRQTKHRRWEQARLAPDHGCPLADSSQKNPQSASASCSPCWAGSFPVCAAQAAVATRKSLHGATSISAVPLQGCTSQQPPTITPAPTTAWPAPASVAPAGCTAVAADSAA